MAEHSPIVIIDPRDDVGVALRALEAGEAVASGVACRQPIPPGHKVAIRASAAGAEVRKYGWPIGRATRSIEAGEHVHVHNLSTALTGEERYTFQAAPPAAARAA